MARLRLLKNAVMTPLGLLAYYRLNVVNNLKVSGLEIFRKLPKKNVLFISNHQTYYADVSAIILAMSAAKWGRKKYMGLPYYMVSPKLNLNYVAATETMKKSGLLPKIFSLCGAVTVDRTWRSKGKNIQRAVKASDQNKIAKALKSGWLVSFPQGTTTPYAPGRKGTAYIIKENKPIVVPIMIDGFRRAFDKRGLAFKKRGVNLKIVVQKPLDINYDDPVETILDQLISAIGQKDPNRPSSVQ